MTSVAKYDTVVLGLGGVGSFALRAAARQMDANMPGGVLGIERFGRCHDQGSSHGHSRVYRMAYFEHSNYVPWVQYSVKEFEALQRNFQCCERQLLHECGVLVVVPKTNRKWLDACLDSAKLHNIPTEFLNVNQLRERFPQFRYMASSGDRDDPDSQMIGLYEPGGGMVRPELAINAALKEAKEQYGATIWENTIVKSLKEVCNGDSTYVELVAERSPSNSGETFEVVTETIQARVVLVGAGAWTSELIPSWQPHLNPVRILQTWVDVSSSNNPQQFDTPRMPCAVIVNPKLPIPVYCLPADSTSSDYEASAIDGNRYFKSCVKLGVHGGDPVEPDKNGKQPVTKEEEEDMIRAIQTTFCDDVARVTERVKTARDICGATIASGHPIETKPCMYTMTQDEHFMIGVPKGFTNVCAVAGLSGHGFKMTPALGQMLADFAIARTGDERIQVLEEKWKAGFCSPSRFGV